MVAEPWFRGSRTLAAWAAALLAGWLVCSITTYYCPPKVPGLSANSRVYGKSLHLDNNVYKQEENEKEVKLRVPNGLALMNRPGEKVDFGAWTGLAFLNRSVEENRADGLAFLNKPWKSEQGAADSIEDLACQNRSYGKACEKLPTASGCLSERKEISMSSTKKAHGEVRTPVEAIMNSKDDKKMCCSEISPMLGAMVEDKCLAIENKHGMTEIYEAETMCFCTLDKGIIEKYVTPDMSLALMENAKTAMCLFALVFYVDKTIRWLLLFLLVGFVRGEDGDSDGGTIKEEICLRNLFERLKRWLRRRRSRGIERRQENRRGRLGRMVLKRQLHALVLLTMMHSAKAMTNEQLLEQIGRMTEAATQAAQAATQAAQAMASSSSSQGASGVPGLESATKILKAPETFSGEEILNFPSWKMQFESWLCFGDSRFSNLLSRVESQPIEPDTSSYGTEQMALANKFYAILSSYLRGRCLQLVRSNSQTKDGFKLWFQLCREFIPSTRQRSLALAQTLGQYPNFPAKVSMLENILQYENLVSQYEMASGQTYPEDLRSATLIRCAPQKLRDHLQLSLTDKSTYADVREALLSYERASKSYSQEQILKHLELKDGDSRDGPTPMEVDRVEKGKGKHKGKGRGGNWWNNAWSFAGRGRGAGRKGKGKGKGKSKGKSKSKSGGKGKKGKNKGFKGKHGKSDREGCWICGSFQHWASECPQQSQPMQVSQVAAEQPQQVLQQQPIPPSSISTASGQTSVYPHSQYRGSASTAPTVRRVYTIQTPSSSSMCPPSESSSSFHHVRMVSSSADNFYLWFESVLDIDEDGHLVSGSISDGPNSQFEASPDVLDRSPGLPALPHLHVRTMRALESESLDFNGDAEEWIILDSGSDVSLLPKKYQADVQNTGYALQDCQGRPLGVVGTKDAEIYVNDVHGEVTMLNHQFIVSDVTSCLVSLGQLYYNGWSIVHADEDESSRLALRSPDGEVLLPVQYRGMSLAIRGKVRCVQQTLSPVIEAIESEEPMQMMELEQFEDEDLLLQMVRMAVLACLELEVGPNNAWLMTEEGIPFHKHTGSCYMDGRPALGTEFPFRSTFIRATNTEEKQWELVEWVERYVDFDDCSAAIEECGSESWLILTMYFKTEGIDIDRFFTVLDENPLSDLKKFAHRLDGEGERDLNELAVDPPADLQFVDKLPEEIAHEDHGGAVDASVPVSQEDHVVVGDLVLTPHSEMTDLRTAAKYVGVSQAGGKAKIFERLQFAAKREERRLAMQMAHEEYHHEEIEVKGREIPKEPTPTERRLHNLTHLPTRAWCDVCVMCKSKDDHHPPVPANVQSQRSFPTIQLDVGRIVGGVDILVMIDSWTRFSEAAPLKKTTRAVGDCILNFIGSLGYAGKVEIACDQERVLVSGAELVRATRARLSLETQLVVGKAFSKGRTAMAERCIQTIRNQQKTLSAYVEDRVKMKLPDEHAIHSWAAVHASWLLNRFGRHQTLKATPYELVHGRPYRGRVCSFGSAVFGLDPTVTKYKAKWKKGIWVGKDRSDQDILISEDELLRTRAVRLCAEEYDPDLLMAMDLLPDALKKSHVHKHSQHRMLLREVPKTPLPLPAFPVEKVGSDAAASDPESSEIGRPRKESGDGRGSGTAAASELPEERPDDYEPESPFEVPMQVEQAGVVSGSTRRPAETEAGAERKIYKHSEEDVSPRASKSPKKELYPPSFAGSVNQVTAFNFEDVEVFAEEEIAEDELSYNLEEYEEFFGLEEEISKQIADQGEGDGPPKLSPEEVQILDDAAMLAEIEKLDKLSVIAPVENEDDQEGVTFLDTTTVFDWRFRQSWMRRCRLVAREYKTSATDETQFSPTSSMFMVKLLLVVGLMLGFDTYVADVKDAFLMVPQQENVWIQVPEWVRSLDSNDSPLLRAHFWKLLRCLPGQRNAALRWADHFRELMVEHGFIPFKGMPTIFRHPSKKIFLTIHVDDVLIVADGEGYEWFRHATRSLTLKVEGPFHQDSHQTIYYLKKRITLSSEGIFIQPNSSHISKLASLLKIDGKKPKTLPHHSVLESFCRAEIDEHEKLDPMQQKTFRSALGIVLYIGMDRPDVQQALKMLSTYMACGTKKSMTALKHLASYLKGTSDLGVLLSKPEGFMLASDLWKIDDWENRQDKSEFNVEVFSDANWAGCKKTRKSTTSFMVFLNGSLIQSCCKVQSSIALSSAESELYAGCAGLVDGIQIATVLRFLLGDEHVCPNDGSRVRLKLYCDSSAARGVMQRLGSGKIKHINIRHLWVQDLLKKRLFELNKVPTKHNVADLNTKKLSKHRRDYLMSLIPMGENSSEAEERRYLRFEDEKKRVLRILMVALGTTTLFGLKGCDSTALVGDPLLNYDFKTMLLSLCIGVIFIQWYYINCFRQQVEQFRRASRAVRQILYNRNHGLPDEPMSPEGEEATVRVFGEGEARSLTRTPSRSRSRSRERSIDASSSATRAYESPSPEELPHREVGEIEPDREPEGEESERPRVLADENLTAEVDLELNPSVPFDLSGVEEKYSPPPEDQDFDGWRHAMLAVPDGPEHRAVCILSSLNKEIRALREWGFPQNVIKQKMMDKLQFEMILSNASQSRHGWLAGAEFFRRLDILWQRDERDNVWSWARNIHHLEVMDFEEYFNIKYSELSTHAASSS